MMYRSRFQRRGLTRARFTVLTTVGLPIYVLRHCLFIGYIGYIISYSCSREFMLRCVNVNGSLWQWRVLQVWII